MNGFKLPASVRLWATYYDGKGKPKWAICSDQARIKYFLYNLESGKPVKQKTAASPAEFENEVGKV
jgi:hypothetical protein